MAKKYNDLVTEAKGDTHSFILWRKQWRAYSGNSLEWQCFKFTKAGLNDVPRKPGVYAFLVQPRLEVSLEVSYLFYIGKTDRTLRQRSKEYLSDYLRGDGRPRIINLLSKYKSYLYFACAPTDTPQQVEDTLLAAFIPPGNDKLPVSVRRIVRAFR